MIFAAKRVLAVSPHPDDAELAAGGTLALFAGSGATVVNVVLGDCRTSRYSKEKALPELRQSAERLGIEVLYSERPVPVRAFSTERQRILNELLQGFARMTYEGEERRSVVCNPEVVLAPCSGDRHQDHAVVAEEVMRAFPSANILGYQQPWNVDRLDLSLLVGFPESCISKKMAALRCYNEQQHRWYFDGEFQKASMTMLGRLSGHPGAEAFEPRRLRWETTSAGSGSSG